MIDWRLEKNGHWLGFVDGDYLYTVYAEDDGWVWEYVPDYEGACDLLETPEEAKAGAEADYLRQEANWSKYDQLEEDMAILGDILFEERRDEGLL